MSVAALHADARDTDSEGGIYILKFLFQILTVVNVLRLQTVNPAS